MPPGLTLKDLASEASLIRSRVNVAIAMVGILTLILVVRLSDLQVVDYEHFRTLSRENRVKLVPLAPTRGLIFDRNGVVLAQNTPSHSLEIVPEAVRDIDAVVAQLKEIIRIEEVDLQRFRRLLKEKRRFQSVPIRFRLSEEEVAQFSVNRHRFPGVDIHARLARHYPLGPQGVHAIGYVARINERELQQVDAANYRATTHIGKTGVEQAYESVLHGRVGHQHVEINAQGRTLRVLSRMAPTPGNNLHLTIDASLQARAEAALGNENGAVVVIEPRSGDILAMASMPGFDPNLFVNGIDPQTYGGLMRSPDRPLFNRVLYGQYPPGSTVKPFVGLAGLEQELEFAHRDTWCPGWYRLKGRAHKYRDWKKGGHGRVDLQRAIVESCDVYFYELALALGIERMHDFLVQFGFGGKTGIDLQGEVAGLMPSSAWKRRARNQPWFPGETLITGIGQGFTLATPLQLASATATLAMRGLRLKPRLVRATEDAVSGAKRPLAPVLLDPIRPRDSASWETVIGAMVDVVHGQQGTARRVGLGAAYRMAGKTGTAQLFAVGQDEEYEEESVAKKLRDHGLFIAFAPPEKPRIAVAVIVENGGSGSRSAAPVTRKIMDHFLVHARNSGDDGDGLLISREDPRQSPGSQVSVQTLPDVTGADGNGMEVQGGG